MELTTDLGGRNAERTDRAQAGATSRKALWTGRLLSGLAIVFLALDALGKLMRAVRARRVTVVDGPFAESKELMGGYVIVDVPSLAEARGWAERYGVAVECSEVDLRAVSAPGPGTGPIVTT